MISFLELNVCIITMGTPIQVLKLGITPTKFTVSKCFQSRFICEVDRTVIAEVVDVRPSCRSISLANQHKLSTWKSWRISKWREYSVIFYIISECRSFWYYVNTDSTAESMLILGVKFAFVTCDVLAKSLITNMSQSIFTGAVILMYKFDTTCRFMYQTCFLCIKPIDSKYFATVLVTNKLPMTTLRLLKSSLQNKSLRNSEQRFLCRFTTQNGVSTPLSTLLVNVDHSDIMSILTRQQNRCWFLGSNLLLWHVMYWQNHWLLTCHNHLSW